MTDTMSMEELRGLFVADHEKKLAQLRSLLQFAQTENSGATSELFRMLHNLAGSGGSYGYPFVSEICTKMKNMIDMKDNGTSVISPDIAKDLQQGIDVLAGYFEKASLTRRGFVPQDTFKPQLVADSMKVFPHTPTHPSDVAMKALVLDDDEASLSLIRWALSRENFEVQQAGDAADADAAFQIERPDIVIVNPKTGNSSGWEFLRRFKRSDSNKLTPIIVLSDSNSIEDRIEANEAKADGFISKPFHPKEILSIIKNGIEKSRAVQDLVIHDPLTGAYSRRYLFERMREEIKRHQRKTDPLCIAIIDLDFFKNVNDRHGHLAGDEILRRFVAFLKKNLRSYDTVGRYGGEEFIVLMPTTARKNAEMVLDRIRSEWASTDHHLGGGVILRVTFSAGIALMERTDARAEDLIFHADRALYSAKDEGRNTIRTEIV